MSKQRDDITVQMALFFLNTEKVHSLQKRKMTSWREVNKDLLSLIKKCLYLEFAS